MEVSELIFSIEWYVKSKNLSLKNALDIRCPMDVETQEEHRQYYSQYLSSVLSITELLCDRATPLRDEFREKLYLTLESNHQDGEQYYGYLRELRNSVVHRGGNLTAAAHIANDFPLVLAPNPVKNRKGNKVYEAPEKYFLAIIEHLEAVLPPMIVSHIKENGWDSVRRSNDEAQEELRQSIEESEAMPVWVKRKAVKSIRDIDLLAIQKQKMELALKTIEATVALPKIA
ncbi:hypothetical protein [Chromohalobacter israelensis]|uniref:hypothetical protein n=1 Tax=Chromohalobacter israelensis TaxID=141390 RepID=UPI000FFEDA0E|nr:hypothetical protein [Chromohalobacter salexigens]